VIAMDPDPAARSPRPLRGGAVMTAAGKVGVTAVGAVTTIAIARLLGPSGSGAYFVAQSLLLLLTVATTLGVEHGIVYFVSSGRWDPRSALGAALKMAAVMGLAGAVIALAVRLAVPSAFADLPLWLVAVVVAGLPFGLAWLYVSYVALAIDRYEAYVLPPFLQAAGALVLAVSGALLYDVEGAVVGLAVSTVLVGIVAVAWAQRRLPRSRPAERGLLRRAISFGVKGYAANALQLLNYRLDLFILAAVASSAAVGQYSVAFAVTSVLWLLPTALADVLYPRVAHLHARDDESAAEQLELVEAKSVRHVTIVALASAASVAFALVFLVKPLFGAEFAPATELGLILLPGATAIGIGGVLSSTIVGRGRPIYSLYSALIVTPVTIALYLWLIPWLDATGAALASTISYGLSFVVASVFYYRATGRRVGPLLIPSRSELDDLRALPTAVAAWARSLRY
jgi:O-antigen/teichoic acid export membrane protein